VEVDFQVIFTASNGMSRFGDIVIDDVKLMTGEECEDIVQTTNEPSSTQVTPLTNVELIYVII